MFIIDPQIINSKVLEVKLGEKLCRYNINASLDEENDIYKGNASMLKILIEIKRNFQKMDLLKEIKEQPIISHRPYLGRIIVFLKRGFRKLTRWLFQTYYNQANEFHISTVQTLSKMIILQEQIIMALQKQERNK